MIEIEVVPTIGEALAKLDAAFETEAKLIPVPYRQIARLKAALFYVAANHQDRSLRSLCNVCNSVAHDLPETGDPIFDRAFAHLAPQTKEAA